MSRNRAKQEKGAARIQQLVEQFPEMSRDRVIAADYRVEGLRHTPVLDDIGRWAWPDAHDHYEYDHDEHGQEDLVGGVARTPKHICFGEGGDHQVAFDSRSPYEVKYEGGGRYWLYRDGDPIREVFFLPCPQWFWKTTSTGKPMNLVTTSNFERRFGVCVTTYCEYFKEGNQCRFCNLNPTAEYFAGLGQQRIRVKQEQDVYETFLAYAQETRAVDISLVGGGFINRSKEADLYVRHLEVLKRAMKDSGCHVDSIILAMQAMEEQDHLRLKEAGATMAHHCLEIWDPKLFQVFCPGKSKHVGRERWIESLLRAVDIFGWGKSGTNFIIGLEMVPPHGFQTEEEAAESVVEGFQYMASRGVALVGQFFQARPRAVLANAPRPRTEYFIRMELERQRLHKEYKLADPSPFHRDKRVQAAGSKGKS